MTDELARSAFSKRHQYARRVVAGCGLLLIAATKPLWFSQGEFPQVPFFELLCETPQWVDWVLSASLVLSLLAMLILKAESRANLIGGALAIGCLSVLIALNQHRLQPWAWFLILATIATSASAAPSLRWLRWLLFGVYFFSGLSKLEPTFVNGGGDWLLDGLMKPFGGSFDTFDASTRRLLLYLMPLGEIVAAFCVIVPRLRLVGFIVVLGMHGTLLLALGPLGLNHRPGVLLWNLEFQLLAFPLLWKLPVEPTELSSAAWNKTIGTIVVACGVLLPCFGQRWMPIVDQWPSWSVYATWAGSTDIEVRVRIDAADRLQKGPQQALARSTKSHGWTGYIIERWSLQTVGAPIYPSRRFHFGVARSISEQSGFRTRHLGTREQFWRSVGDAELAVIGVADDLNKATDQFLFNTRPRKLPTWPQREPAEPEYLK